MLNPISSPKSILVFSLLALTLFPACPSGFGDLNECGDGHIQVQEECDDGRKNGDDAECTSTCQIAVCGDGLVLESVEACDDGPLNSSSTPDACRENCTLPRCGDGLVDSGETCDDGAFNSDRKSSACRTDCTEFRCGDGVVDGGEACDDGNSNNFDKCTNNCTWRAQCGNGEVEFGEACDDGNRNNLDECTNTCTRPECGNGVVEFGEACDDGNSRNTDACLKSCSEASCGDGFVQTSVEECDDGDGVDNDSCSNSCLIRAPLCGDGTLDAGEACDDGNRIGNDFCSNSCATRNPVCGDGVLDVGELCDDGNAHNTDECLMGCTLASCGDGFVRAGVEQCDDGNRIDNDACSNRCATRNPVCGDGTLDAGEACDDGNRVNNDTCSNVCAIRNPVCGDGTLDAGETCDDGNRRSYDSCPDGPGGTCQQAFCGDGFVRSGVEECDDGNDDETDDCLTSCKTAFCGDGIVEEGVEECDAGRDNGRGVGYCNRHCLGVVAPWGMVLIPAGEFYYGHDEFWTAGAFFIDTFEVTAGDYRACVYAGGCRYNGSTSASNRTYRNGKDGYPINYVNWQEAADYCSWKGKRLPREEEWEKAARGPDGRSYPWGNQAPTCGRAAFKGCSTGPVPVGSKPEGGSPYGVHDMAGNVWEWTDSWFSVYQHYRVARGGSFDESAYYVRSSYRNPALSRPEFRFATRGFRCAQSQ